jgi:hypothetical protein
MKADEIYRYYLLGQRMALGINDRQVARGICEHVEDVIQEAVADHEQITPTLMHRYLTGELTEGMPPLERLPHAEEKFRALEWLFTTLELLRMKADGGKPALPRTCVVGKRERLQRGEYGPFVITQVAGEPAVLCWACRTEQPYDLVMALPDLMCPDCGAISTREICAEVAEDEVAEADVQDSPAESSIIQDSPATEEPDGSDTGRGGGDPTD